MASMFWGLKLEPGKRYSTTVDKSFHISMATLDTTSVGNDNEVVSVALEEGGRGDVFFLTNLRKRDILSVQLDLNFMTGDRITLFCKGQGVVHLSGYMVLDDDDELSNTMIDDEAEEEEEEDEDADDEAEESFMNSLKGLGNKKVKELAAAAASQKRKQEVESNKKSKKKKLEIPKQGKSEDDSEEETEEDDDLNNLIADEDSDAEMEEEEDDEGDEDDDEGEEEEEEEEEEKPEIKIPKKQKNQQQQQQQNQKNKTPNRDQQQQGKKQQKQQTPKTLNGLPSPTLKQNQSEKKDDKKKQSMDKSPGKQQNQKQQGNETALTGGVKIKDVKQGNGPLCKTGKMASVYYTGRLKANGKVFDSVTQGSGFKFRVGQGEVIKGWDTGVSGMKVGGKRIITCPPQAAYGAKGAPPQIPPNSTLVFEVELKGVN